MESQLYLSVTVASKILIHIRLLTFIHRGKSTRATSTCHMLHFYYIIKLFLCAQEYIS